MDVAVIDVSPVIVVEVPPNAVDVLPIVIVLFDICVPFT